MQVLDWNKKTNAVKRARALKANITEDQARKANERSRLAAFGESIKKTKWRSDEWLKKRWFEMDMMPLDLRTPDQFNKVTPPYIPDLINYWFKYVIECDGSVHDRPDVQARDRRKDLFFKANGFKVFRVRVGDQRTLEKIAKLIRNIRAERGAPPACKIYRG